MNNLNSIKNIVLELHYLKWELPDTKTILRARQRIQEKHPELTDKETAEKRNRHRKQMKQLVLDGFFDSDDIECEGAE